MQPASKLAAAFARGMATTAKGKERKVAVLRAAGGIGQPLSLLMTVRARPGGGRQAPRSRSLDRRVPQHPSKPLCPQMNPAVETACWRRQGFWVEERVVGARNSMKGPKPKP